MADQWTRIGTSISLEALEALVASLRDGSSQCIPPRGATSLAPLVRALGSPSGPDGAACQLQACIALRCVAKVMAPLLLQASGCVHALVAAAAASKPAKLRGWALSALALLARSGGAGARAVLSTARPVLLDALSQEPECQTWAAEALASLSARYSAAAPLVHAGAVPRLCATLHRASAAATSDRERAAAHAAVSALHSLVLLTPARAQLCAAPHALTDLLGLAVGGGDGAADGAAQLLVRMLSSGGDTYTAARGVATSPRFTNLARLLLVDDHNSARSRLLAGVVLAVGEALAERGGVQHETRASVHAPCGCDAALPLGTAPPCLDAAGLGELPGLLRALALCRPPGDDLARALDAITAFVIRGTANGACRDAARVSSGEAPNRTSAAGCGRPAVCPDASHVSLGLELSGPADIARAAAEWRRYQELVAQSNGAGSAETVTTASCEHPNGPQGCVEASVDARAAPSVADPPDKAALARDDAERLRLVVSRERRERAAEQSKHAHALAAAQAEASALREAVADAEALAAGAGRAAAHATEAERAARSAADETEAARVADVRAARCATRHVRDECCKLEKRLESAAAELSKAAAVTSAAEAARRTVASRCRALEAASARAEREAAAAMEGKRVAERSLAAEAALRLAAERRSTEARATAEAQLCQAAAALQAAEEAARLRLSAVEGEGARTRAALYACGARAEAAEAGLEREGGVRRAAEGEAARAVSEAAASVQAAWRDAAEWRRAAEERERAVCYLGLELEHTQALLARLAGGIDQMGVASEGARPAEPPASSTLATRAVDGSPRPGKGSLPAEGMPAPPFAVRRSPPPSALPVPRVLCRIAPNTMHNRQRASPLAGTKLKHAAVTPRGCAMSEMRRKLLRVLTHDRDALRIQLEQVRQQSAALTAAAS
mmetsp:Transcript_1938/g.6406  ORF Transcript_1938/g.6406 Transcript_1938/m.6406 type:complete len:910 (+) Transcript_1938:441-3170(+)